MGRKTVDFKQSFLAKTKYERFLFLFQYFCLFLLFLGTAIIWYESLKPGNESSQTSAEVGKVIQTFSSEQDDEIKATDFVLTNSQTTYRVGDNVSLTFSCTPNNATVVDLSFVSSDITVANVDAFGKITFLDTGTVKLTATLSETEIIREITFTVKPKKNESTTAITITAPSVFVNGSVEIITKDNLNNRVDAVYSIGETDVAELKNGFIKGLKEGSFTLTAEYDDLTHSIEISVKPEQLVVAPNEITLITQLKSKYYVGESETLSYSVLPDAAEQAVAISIISGKCNLKQHKLTFTEKGEVSIKLYALSTPTVEKIITLTVAEVMPEKLEIVAKSSEMYSGKATKLTAVFSNSPTNQKIIWSIDDNKRAEVSANGVLSAKRAGSVTVTAVSEADPTVSASFTFQIKVQSRFNYLVRKVVGHWGGFFCLGLVAGISLFLLFKDKRVAVPLILFVGFFIAGVSEILQLPIFTTGRGATLRDVGIDYFGYVTALCCLLLFYVIFCSVRKSVRRSKSAKA